MTVFIAIATKQSLQPNDPDIALEYLLALNREPSLPLSVRHLLDSTSMHEGDSSLPLLARTAARMMRDASTQKD